MKVTLGRLRGLIREELSRKTAVVAVQLMRDVIVAGEGYIRATRHNTDDPGQYHDAIDAASEKLTALAKWLMTHREPEGKLVVDFSRGTAKLVELTRFLKRPVFMGKESHVHEVEELVLNLKKLNRESRATMRAVHAA